jgi:drug/metabolite transporter (DMT)-like permease
VTHPSGFDQSVAKSNLSGVLILCAVAAALFYGVADYSGARATRHTAATSVTFAGQSVALLLLLAIVPLTRAQMPSLGDWIWSGGAGLGGALALVSFYTAMSHGSMTVIAPISAVIGMSIPVIVGLAQGERPAPIAFLGIAMAIAAVALVSDVLDHHDLPTPWSAIGLAAVAGIGFGLIFVCLNQTSKDIGLWPLVGQRLVSIPTVGLLILFSRHRRKIPRGIWPLVVLSGVLDTAANGLYLIAVRAGMLSLVSVITALYPVSTVMLALRFDREKLHRSQWLGMALGGASLVIVGYASSL